MSDYIPDYITNADYRWTYCPYCDTAPVVREHPAAKYSRDYRNVRTCWCGAIRTEVGWFNRFKSQIEPWYIKRMWRKQYYKGDGHGSINEFLNGAYIGTYPVSQHIDEMLAVMPIDMGLGVRP